MRKYFEVLFTALLFIPLTLFSQEPAFKVNISADSIGFGNYFEVTFSIENIDGDFTPPDFNDFEIVGGPNHSSMMSMINGKVTRSSSYSYFLSPKREGRLMIGEAQVRTREKIFSSEPIEIIVGANPDGIINSPQNSRRRYNPYNDTRPVPENQQEPKRKTYKI